MEVREHFFIGGTMVAPAGNGTVDVIGSGSGEVIGRFPEATNADMEAAVRAARTAFDSGTWTSLTPIERAGYLTKLSAALQARAQEFAEVIGQQNGSPVSWGIFGQVYSATMALDYYAKLAETYHFEEVRAGMLGAVLVRREPVGVVAAIVPWNVPLFVSMLKLAPALLAGCTVVLKPAPETPLDAYRLAEVLTEIGLPPGVVNIVPAGREAGDYLVRHPEVDKVAFTGSTAAGKKIMAACAERLARVTLELGGKSAAILLPDADLSVAIPGLLPNSFMNNGQACVAQTRILAPRDRYSEIVDAASEWVSALQTGDPMDPATTVGPLVAERQRDRVEGYIKTGQDEGAKVAIGGGRPAGLDRGWYVEPTLFVDVDPSMTIAQEEIFGPVVAVIPYDTVADAVRIANDSAYGLSGSVWSADPAVGLDIARQIRTGTYSINGFGLAFEAPFGGYKQSGLGRELGPEGLEAYLESKSICLAAGQEVPGVPTV